MGDKRRKDASRSAHACCVEDVATQSPTMSRLPSSGLMRTHGWQEPFRQRPWVEIQAFLEGMAVRDARFQHMSNIVESVLTSDQAEALAACTSMHDLIVVPAPVSKPPYGVVVVRAPGSLHEPATGFGAHRTPLRHGPRRQDR